VHSGVFLAYTNDFVVGNCVKKKHSLIFLPVYLFHQKDQIMITLAKQLCIDKLSDKDCPAQMLEAASDLVRRQRILQTLNEVSISLSELLLVVMKYFTKCFSESC